MHSNGNRPKFPPGMDADSIRMGIEEHRRNNDAIEGRFDELLIEHEGDWVAACGAEYLFAPTLQGVVDAARERGWPMGVVAVQHLRSERPPILL